MPGQRIRLKCGYSLGDLVVLSGAVRDLHRAHPGQFLTSVDTGCPDLWRHNPFIVPDSFGALEIDCNQVDVDREGRREIHYLQAYLELLNKRLGARAVLSEPRGDIHLSWEERNWYSDIWSLCGKEVPFWIICPGGKFDIPIKWWEHKRYQEVADHFRGRIQFVQVGWWGNHHPRIEGAIDLRGKTNVRDLIHLMYNADGVLCGVTSLMHLAAAVPVPGLRARQAVIIGGAREPSTWEAYPGHEFITTEKSVECAHCWRNRVQPLPDNRNLRSLQCTSINNALPRCMDQITSRDVIERFEKLNAGGKLRLLSNRFYSFAEKAIARAARQNSYERENLHLFNAPAKANDFIDHIPPYPRERFSSRGIILCSGGVKYFTNAWVCIRMLRQHGCQLPIELWHLGKNEIDRKMEALLAPLGVRCVNARKEMNGRPMRNPLGWELKSYALLRTRFREVLFLDSDNVATRNPEFLFETAEYRSTGAIFWPDYRKLGPRRPIWKLCGIPYRDEPEFESGQMLINKETCWKPLNLAFWYNDHSEFFYQHIHGDKETFHLAWRRLDAPYAMPPFPIKTLPGTMCQHDFDGRILFQHRNLRKWQFFGENSPVPGFLRETDCLRHLEDLRRQWDGKINGRFETFERRGFQFRKDTGDFSIFSSVVEGNEYELSGQLNGGTVIDVGAHIGSFAAAVLEHGAGKVLAFEPATANYQMAKMNLRRFPTVKLVQAAILHRTTRVDCHLSATVEEESNTGGITVTESPSGQVRAFALDDILRKEGKVALLKLDCEGSEWPILFFSEELCRVNTICGEYHEQLSHPLCSHTASALNRQLLVTLLRQHFPRVRVFRDKRSPGLGKFWASREPMG